MAAVDSGLFSKGYNPASPKNLAGFPIPSMTPSVAFLYTNRKYIKKEIMDSLPFTVVAKNNRIS